MHASVLIYHAALQSQLRNKLVTELTKRIEGSGINSLSPETVCKSLRVQVADSIVAEYLKSAGYEYSLSIFLPEAGVRLDKVREGYIIGSKFNFHACHLSFPALF